jgi:hypothetical protein
MPRPRKKADASLTLFSFQDIMCCLVGVLVLISLTLAMDGLRAETKIETARQDPAAVAAAKVEAEEQSAELEREIAQLRKDFQARQAGSAVTLQEVEVLEARMRQDQEAEERLRRRLAALEAQLAESRSASEARASEMAQLRDRVATAELRTRRERVRLRPGAVGNRAPFFVEVSANALRIGDLADGQAPVLVKTLPGTATNAELLESLAPRDPGSRYAVFIVHSDGIRRFEELRDTLFRSGYEVGWQLWDGAAGAFLERAPEGKSGGGAT